MPKFMVPDGRTESSVELLGPSNAASITYGNGYDKCGPLTFSLETL